MDALANTQILVVIVVAAAFSCLVGWLLEGGFDLVRERWLALTQSDAARGEVRPAQQWTREFGDEWVRAYGLAIRIYVDFASDEQAIVEAIVDQLGWTPTRARWFFAVNREQVEQAARQMQTEQRRPTSSCGK